MLPFFSPKVLFIYFNRFFSPYVSLIEIRVEVPEVQGLCTGHDTLLIRQSISGLVFFPFWIFFVSRKS